MSPDRRLWIVIIVVAVLAGGGFAAATRPPQSGAEGLEEPVSVEQGSPERAPALSSEQRLAEMNGNQLNEILGRRQRIEALPPAARQRLREIHQQWLAHPRRDELLETMQAYYQWWTTLTIEERSRVRAETDSRRLDVIRGILQQRAEAVFGIAGETQLPRDDVSQLFEWNREFLSRRRDQIVELYRSSANRRSRRLDSRLDRPEVLFFVLDRIPDDLASSLIEQSDIDLLREKLSDEAVAIIDAQEDHAARQKLVYRWVMSAVSAQWNPPIDERELMEFYDLEMTQRQRQLVDAMSPQRRRSAIAQMYRARRRNQSIPISPFGVPEVPRDDPAERQD